jgi:hypothetical protein
MLRLLICLVLLFAFPFQAHSALKLIPETAEETASRLSDVVQAVNKVSPSVVSIVSTRTANVNPFQGMAGDPFLEKFFGRNTFRRSAT